MPRILEHRHVAADFLDPAESDNAQHPAGQMGGVPRPEFTISRLSSAPCHEALQADDVTAYRCRNHRGDRRPRLPPQPRFSPRSSGETAGPRRRGRASASSCGSSAASVEDKIKEKALPWVTRSSGSTSIHPTRRRHVEDVRGCVEGKAESG